MSAMDAWPTLIVTQLLVQAPVLLAYLTGCVFALAWWRHSRAALLLALAGCVLLLADGVVVIYAGASLSVSRVRLAWDNAQFTLATSVLGLIGSAVRAIGIGLLLSAVFVDRREAAPTVQGNTYGPA